MRSFGFTASRWRRKRKHVNNYLICHSERRISCFCEFLTRRIIYIVDYSYSFLDFDPTKIQIFHIIKENEIDIPLLTENQKAYDLLKEQAKNVYIELFEKSAFKNLEDRQQSVW